MMSVLDHPWLRERLESEREEVLFHTEFGDPAVHRVRLSIRQAYFRRLIIMLLYKLVIYADSRQITSRDDEQLRSRGCKCTASQLIYISCFLIGTTRLTEHAKSAGE